MGLCIFRTGISAYMDHLTCVSACYESLAKFPSPTPFFFLNKGAKYHYFSCFPAKNKT